MRITRREILKAIRTEKLKEGEFVQFNHLTAEYESGCRVCAVGAVLRQKGLEGIQISRAGESLIDEFACSNDGDEWEALKKGLYLNALSIRFEKLAQKHGCGKRTKEKLASFVKRYFPKTIKHNFPEVNSAD